MVGIPNKQNISWIVMRPFASCLCAIGRDWYHIDFEVQFQPALTYPDYMVVDRYVWEKISGKELNIEEAVSVLGDWLNEQYKPAGLSVSGTVEKVNTHFPVTVTKVY